MPIVPKYLWKFTIKAKTPNWFTLRACRSSRVHVPPNTDASLDNVPMIWCTCGSRTSQSQYEYKYEQRTCVYGVQLCRNTIPWRSTVNVHPCECQRRSWLHGAGAVAISFSQIDCIWYKIQFSKLIISTVMLANACLLVLTRLHFSFLSYFQANNKNSIFLGINTNWATNLYAKENQCGKRNEAKISEIFFQLSLSCIWESRVASFWIHFVVGSNSKIHTTATPLANAHIWFQMYFGPRKKLLWLCFVHLFVKFPIKFSRKSNCMQVCCMPFIIWVCVAYVLYIAYCVYTVASFISFYIHLGCPRIPYTL